jgi:hypothetical protein
MALGRGADERTEERGKTTRPPPRCGGGLVVDDVAYFSQLGIGVIASFVDTLIGELLVLVVENTVVFGSTTRVGAEVPFGATVAMTPPNRPWWFDDEYFSGVMAGVENVVALSDFKNPARVTVLPSALRASTNATA